MVTSGGDFVACALRRLTCNSLVYYLYKRPPPKRGGKACGPKTLTNGMNLGGDIVNLVGFWWCFGRIWYDFGVGLVWFWCDFDGFWCDFDGFGCDFDGFGCGSAISYVCSQDILGNLISASLSKPSGDFKSTKLVILKIKCFLISMC